VFGQPVGCGYGLNAVSRDASCFVPRVRGCLASEGLGDVGLCLELCDVTADCEQGGQGSWVCAVTEVTLARTGRGVCSLAPPALDGGLDAGDAGEDGGNGNPAVPPDAALDAG
jgi:hypothetical protein